MDINYFKEFSMLAETNNYWEAAEKLHMNQSTLSKHIKAMENELGVPLFIRTTRKVSLSEFGRILLPYARSITQNQLDYCTALMQAKAKSKGLITIGSIPVMAQYHITKILVGFKNAYPQCSFKILEDDPKNLKELLLAQKCELVFLRETELSAANIYETADGIVHVPYITDHMVALLPRSHPLSGRQEVTLQELRDENFCFLKESSMMSDFCRQSCQKAGFTPNVVFDSHRLDSIFDMVAQGSCTALLMDQHVKDYMDSSLSVPFTLAKIVPVLSTQISLCYLKGVPLSQAASRFLEYFHSIPSLPFE